MTTLINDPQGIGTIDVTGWDLDGMREILASLEADIRLGAIRPLTDGELDLITSPYGLAMGPAWDTEDNEVIVAALRLRQIVDEAIFQRDLAGALAGLTTGAPLTVGQRIAYDEYTGLFGR